MRTIMCFFLLLASTNLLAQTATFKGKIRDLKSGFTLELVNVGVSGTTVGTSSEAEGDFTLTVPAGKQISIIFASLGYYPKTVNLLLKEGQVKDQLIYLKPRPIEIDTVEVIDRSIRRNNVIKINPQLSKVIANPSGSFEKVLVSMGASSNNELSSQYSVRGGNFDENIIYVNDIEIYRPQLIRQGQQEGLSFINPNLVSSVSFYTGGFEAKYGDKLSSVLDIKYKKPKKFVAGAEASFMGGALYTEAISNDQRWTFLTGARYRTLGTLLAGLDINGDYKPSSSDVQTYLTFTPDWTTKRWEFGFLANYNSTKFLVEPQDRETDFGTVQSALRLKVFFDGLEQTRYQTLTLGATATYRPNHLSEIKLIASTFLDDETEFFDVEGAYLLDVVDNNLGSDDFGEVAYTIGAGVYHNYGRNQLNARVTNLEYKHKLEKKRFGFWEWGLRWQHDDIFDRLYEWRRIDSAAFSVPAFNDSVVRFEEFIDARANIISDRLLGYYQNSLMLDDRTDMYLNFGLRANFWTFNKEMLLSPRIQFSFRPSRSKDLVLRAATGIYSQPAFYREMRNLDGSINESIQAQKSAHLVLGSDLGFKAWGRDFRFVTEAYYKHLYNAIPYDIDNVRIRYYADKQAQAYATGIDFRVNGQFVKTLESWASLAFLWTQENIEGDFYYTDDSVRTEIGWIRRPSDRRFNFNIMFQDLLPTNPSYKVHLSLVYGARMPFTPLNNQRLRNQLTIPAYRRVDIGFSKQLVGKDVKFKASGFLKSFESLWLSAEVFNLLQIQNTISYIWVRDVSGTIYGVPNYLTNRQINLRLVAEF